MHRDRLAEEKHQNVSGTTNKPYGTLSFEEMNIIIVREALAKPFCQVRAMQLVTVKFEALKVCHRRSGSGGGSVVEAG